MNIINFFSENYNFFIIVIAFLSLMVGSFLNVVIYRLPRMMHNEWTLECRHYLGLKNEPEPPSPFNLWLPLSHCPHCKKRIKAAYNVPIISYLFLKGRCVNCHSRISLRYPLVEFLCCIASLYVAWRFGFSWQTVGGLCFTWIVISLTFIDLDHQLLPDQLTLLLLWIGLLLSPFSIFVDCKEAIFGGAAGYLLFALTQAIFKLITGKVGMGQGDFKFLAALGAFMGWQQLPIIILFSSVLGILISLIHMLYKRDFKSNPLPFGPYLAFAGWICLMWGKDILHLYLRTLTL